MSAQENIRKVILYNTYSCFVFATGLREIKKRKYFQSFIPIHIRVFHKIISKTK